MHRLRKRRPQPRLFLTLFLALAAPAGASAQAISEPEATASVVDDPEALAELAVTSHPSIEATRSQVEALRDLASVARLWGDPMVGVEYSNVPVDRPILGAHPMSGLQLRLQQQLPAPGEPRARAAVADAKVDAAEIHVEEAANLLRGEIRARYWDLALVRQLRVVTQEHLDQLDGLIASVDARYQVGGAAQHAVLQLVLRRDRLAEALVDFDALEAAILAALNGALARDPAQAVSTPDRTPTLGLPGDETARRARLEQHPAVRALRARADVARAEAARARIEAAPEPTVWLGYRVRAPMATGDPGTDLVSAGFSMPLPFASTRRWRAQALAATDRARADDEAASGKLDRLRASLAAAEARFNRAADRARAYADQLEPAARTTLSSTLSSYQVDRADFADLIRAEIDLLDVQRKRLEAETDAAARRAEIMTLLDATPTTGASR